MPLKTKINQQNKKRLWLWLSITLLSVVSLLSVGAWLFIGGLPVEAQFVESVKSLAEKQLKQEKALISTDFSADDPKIVVNPYGISPLSAVILFKTDQPIKPEVKIIGKDDLTTFSHTFDESKEHRLPIYGLYAGQENQVELKVGDEVKKLAIKTEALPEKFPKIVDVRAKKDKLTNDLYFMSNSSADSKTIAYDVNGDVRWYLNGKFGWEVTRSKQNGRFFVGTERIIKEPYYNTGFYEIDLLGKIYTEYTLPGGYHHDLFERENGNLIVASCIVEGDRKTVEDVVVEIDRETGKVIKTIDLSKIWPMDTGKSIAWSEKDWFHNNSVSTLR